MLTSKPSTRSLATIKITNLAESQALKKAHVLIDAIESDFMNTETKDTTVKPLVTKLDELLQVQVTVVRNSSINKDMTSFFMRLGDTQKGLFYNIGESYRTMFERLTEKISLLGDKVQKLGDKNLDLEMQIKVQKDLRSLGKKELDRALEEYMDSEMIVRSLHESLELA